MSLALSPAPDPTRPDRVSVDDAQAMLGAGQQMMDAGQELCDAEMTQQG